MKRRVLVAAGLVLALMSCGAKQQSVTADMAIRSPDAGKTMLLIQSAERVMERRLAAAQVKGGHATAITSGPSTAKLTVRVPDAAAEVKAKDILAEPFFFDLRIEKPNTDALQPSEWIPTALTGSSLEWIQAVGNSTTGEVTIELQFTPEGRTLLESVFKGNVSKHIGIFVRDLLVSKLTIQTDAVTDRVIISGIPSSKVAEIFADDVNVGLRVTYTNIR